MFRETDSVLTHNAALVMNKSNWKEPLVDQQVTYTLEIDGKFIVIENVPAPGLQGNKVEFFSTKTVEQLQQTIWEHKEPARFCGEGVSSSSQQRQ